VPWEPTLEACLRKLWCRPDSWNALSSAPAVPRSRPLIAGSASAVGNTASRQETTVMRRKYILFWPEGAG
jgi:hypothetical protein